MGSSTVRLGGVAPGRRTTSQKLWRCNRGPGLASHLHLVGLREGCIAIAMSRIGRVPHFDAVSDAGRWLVMLPGWERLSTEGSSFDGEARRTQVSLASHSHLGTLAFFMGHVPASCGGGRAEQTHRSGHWRWQGTSVLCGAAAGAVLEEMLRPPPPGTAPGL